MKNSLNLYVIFTVLFFLSSCTIEELDKELAQQHIDTFNQKNVAQDNDQLPIRSDNELIISFNEKTPEIRKRKLRYKYGVKKYERCNCSNQRIEKWVFDSDQDVEGRLGDISQETDVEGGDFQYYLINKDQQGNIDLAGYNNPSLTPFINTNPNGVNIGVLDTGINLHMLQKDTPFLYKTNKDGLCKENGQEEISGWDFVNNDNDPFDELGHGTAVTDRIINELDQESTINYSILPVKVFNHLGKGNTFDILCGYLFTVQKKNIHIINMSFGWYGAPSTLLDLYVQENNHILHITSAGNSNVNNDSTPHFPSSIPYNNVLAIGSYKLIKESRMSLIQKSSFSNYGSYTVDYLSQGEGIFFKDKANNSYPLSGTSYAAPLVTGRIAKHLNDVGLGNPSHALYLLWDHAIVIPGIYSLPVYYNNRIIK